MDDLLVRQFIAQYEAAAAAPAAAPDPTLEELIDMEDELTEAVGALDFMEASEEQRGELRGKRVADMPDLMFEVAQALGDCRQIREAVRTDPQVFERIATQDMALGGLIQVLQSLSNGADNALLLCGGRAEERCQSVDGLVEAARRDQAIPAVRREVMSDLFADPLTLRRQGLGRIEADPAALREARTQMGLATGREESAALVRELVGDALAEATTRRTP